MRRNTKADRILNDSAMRLEAARMRHQLAQSQLNTANAVLEAMERTHDALVKELTPAPRKKAEKPSASPPAPKEPAADKEAKCGICGNVKNHSDHDRSYIKSHDFEPPKSVARAPRKSNKKSEATSSDQSSEMQVEGAGNAALAASGGD